MNQVPEHASVEWLVEAINALPSDDPVPHRTSGYNEYTTQKAHWLGWLSPVAGTGSYPRRSGNERGARYVYNHIVEPKMLLWLIAAAGVRQELVDVVRATAASGAPMPTRAAAIRKLVPWVELEVALSRCVQVN